MNATVPVTRPLPAGPAGFELTVVRPGEAFGLAAVLGLRRVAYQGVVPEPDALAAVQGDELEASAWHYLVSRDGALVASGRMTIHEEVGALPDPGFLLPFAAPVPVPVASLNRLVVHPTVRGNGISSWIDDVRVIDAATHGARAIAASVLSDSAREASLIRRGFRVVGTISPDESFAINGWRDPTTVLVLTLP